MGMDPVLTGSTSGFVTSDNVTTTYSRTPGETVLGGPYEQRDAKSVFRAENYDITYNTANFTITPAALTVSADNQTKVYGTLNPTLTGTLSGVVNGDNITAGYSTSAGQFSDVVAGGYAITATLNDPSGRLSNYAVVNTSGTLTITPAVQTISWSNPADIVYGTALSGTQLDATAAGVPGGAAAGGLSYFARDGDGP